MCLCANAALENDFIGVIHSISVFFHAGVRIQWLHNEGFSVPYLPGKCQVLHWSVVFYDPVRNVGSLLMQRVKGPLTGLSCLFVFVLFLPSREKSVIDL